MAIDGDGWRRMTAMISHRIAPPTGRRSSYAVRLCAEYDYIAMPSDLLRRLRFEIHPVAWPDRSLFPAGDSKLLRCLRPSAKRDILRETPSVPCSSCCAVACIGAPATCASPYQLVLWCHPPSWLATRRTICILQVRYTQH